MEDYLIKYKGFVVEPVFLKTSSSISYDSKWEIARNTVEMYVDQEDRRKLKTEEYEGRISTEGKIEFIGSYGGQILDVFLDTNNGEESIRFLLRDITRRDHAEPGALN